MFLFVGPVLCVYIDMLDCSLAGILFHEGCRLIIGDIVRKFHFHACLAYVWDGNLVLYCVSAQGYWNAAADVQAVYPYCSSGQSGWITGLTS